MNSRTKISACRPAEVQIADACTSAKSWHQTQIAWHPNIAAAPPRTPVVKPGEASPISNRVILDRADIPPISLLLDVGWSGHDQAGRIVHRVSRRGCANSPTPNMVGRAEGKGCGKWGGASRIRRPACQIACACSRTRRLCSCVEEAKTFFEPLADPRPFGDFPKLVITRTLASVDCLYAERRFEACVALVLLDGVRLTSLVRGALRCRDQHASRKSRSFLLYQHQQLAVLIVYSLRRLHLLPFELTCKTTDRQSLQTSARRKPLPFYTHTVMADRSRGGYHRADNPPSMASSRPSVLTDSSSGSARRATLDDDDDEDDYLYNDKALDKRSGTCISTRGMLNVLTLILLALGLLALFLGYPLVVVLSKVFDSIDINQRAQSVSLQSHSVVSWIQDTPQSAMRRTSPVDGSAWHLVFSDEFEQEGRSFWPGDDPYWEAVDLWYWGTGDLEWYSPEAVNTTGGALVISVEERETNNKNFRSGMVQSWNKVCFQGAYYEISARLPEATPFPDSHTSTEPDRPKHSTPEALFSASYNNELSWLPGMRYTSCNCPGTEHPGPNHGVARSAPELDILEAKINVAGGHGETSQSLQMAPFDVDYYYGNSTAAGDIVSGMPTPSSTRTRVVPSRRAVSALSQVPDIAYENTVGGRYVTFGVEYSPDWNENGDASVTWYMDGRPMWTLNGQAIGPVPELDVSQRLVPTEPMFMILNVAISESFQVPDFTQLEFPAHMYDRLRARLPARRPARPRRMRPCEPPDVRLH
ncbi:hypothetical protein L1887_57366 [Cichorium endivia]|nr:hypothetical protein L1887_57366 [Cichorium endivia]